MVDEDIPLPALRVDRAGVKGHGVFATKLIPEATFLLSFRNSGLFLSYNESKQRWREQHCLQIDSGKYIWVKASPQRYVNHSCEPNAGLRDCTELYALRDITAGEEISFDYSTTMDEDDWEMDCACGVPSCRRRIRDFKYLPPELQIKYRELGIVGDFCLRAAPRICSQCNGACCSQNCVDGQIEPPFLTPYDTRRTRVATRLRCAEFSTKRVRVNEHERGKRHAYRYMRTKPVGRGCMFFNEETRQCNIYSSRPLDCQLFPLDVIQEDGEYYLIVHSEFCVIEPDQLREYVAYADTHIIPRLRPYLKAYANAVPRGVSTARWQKIKKIELDT